jgi:hypothetical protein
VLSLAKNINLSEKTRKPQTYLKVALLVICIGVALMLIGLYTTVYLCFLGFLILLGGMIVVFDVFLRMKVKEKFFENIVFDIWFGQRRKIGLTLGVAMLLSFLIIMASAGSYVFSPQTESEKNWNTVRAVAMIICALYVFVFTFFIIISGIIIHFPKVIEWLKK